MSEKAALIASILFTVICVFAVLYACYQLSVCLFWGCIVLLGCIGLALGLTFTLITAEEVSRTKL